MITFQLEYTIEPDRTEDFRAYAEQFVALTRKYGGEHYGYFIDPNQDTPAAVALFAFPDLERYDAYRKQVLNDPEYEAAIALAKRTQCIRCCNRTVYKRRIA